MQQVRVGFIGCGNIAQRHFSHLQRIKEARLTAFCDVDELRAAEAAGRFNGACYTDYRELLEKQPLDAVYICTPTFAREDQEVMAAQRGLHVFVEKPVALDLEKARGNQQALERSGVIVSVGYILRYLKAVEKIKKLLQGRRISLVAARYFGGLPSMTWFGQIETSGGQIVDQTSHLLDLMGYFLGEAESVSAIFGNEIFREQPGLNIADSGVVAIRYCNGTLAGVANSCCLGFPGPAPGLFLVAEGLYLELTYSSFIIKTAKETREEAVDLSAGYAAESRAFVDAILTGRRELILCNYADGVKTLAVALAANRAATEQRPIAISEMFATPPA